MYIQNINIGWHEQDPERLDPPLVWSPNSEKQGQVNLRASGTLLQSCTMTGFPRVATWPASPLSRGNLSFPWAAASTCRISSPSISPVTPKIRAYNCIVFWSTRKRDARSASTSLSPWCITWQDGCCNISMTCTIRESMLIWSSKMAVTTEMRKSARNLALMWSHFVGIRFTLSYTFLDGALQSGQRSKDLDLPTSDSSSPSASNNQFNSFNINKWHLNFVLSERIAVGSHKLDNSFKIALPRTDWVTKDPCISLGKKCVFVFPTKTSSRLSENRFWCIKCNIVDFS